MPKPAAVTTVACWRLQTSRAGLSRLRAHISSISRGPSRRCPSRSEAALKPRPRGNPGNMASTQRGPGSNGAPCSIRADVTALPLVPRARGRGCLDPYRPPRPGDLPGQGPATGPPDRHPERPLRPGPQAPVPGRVSHSSSRCSLPRSGPGSGPSVSSGITRERRPGSSFDAPGSKPSWPLADRAKPAYQVSFVTRCTRPLWFAVRPRMTLTLCLRRLGCIHWPRSCCVGLVNCLDRCFE
jgi:hypothetical protein